MESVLIAVVPPLISIAALFYQKRVRRCLQNKTAYNVFRKTKQVVSDAGSCRLDLMDDNHRHTITASMWLREDGYHLQFVDNSVINPGVPYLIVTAGAESL